MSSPFSLVRFSYSPLKNQKKRAYCTGVFLGLFLRFHCLYRFVYIVCLSGTWCLYMFELHQRKHHSYIVTLSAFAFFLAKAQKTKKTSAHEEHWRTIFEPLLLKDDLQKGAVSLPSRRRLDIFEMVSADRIQWKRKGTKNQNRSNNELRMWLINKTKL